MQYEISLHCILYPGAYSPLTETVIFGVERSSFFQKCVEAASRHPSMPRALIYMIDKKRRLRFPQKPLLSIMGHDNFLLYNGFFLLPLYGR